MTDIQWLGKKQKEVFLAIEKIGESTDAEIAHYLDLPINTITPRRNELMQQGYVIHTRKRLCNVTHMKVKAWNVIGHSVKIKDGMEEFF